MCVLCAGVHVAGLSIPGEEGVLIAEAAVASETRGHSHLIALRVMRLLRRLSGRRLRVLLPLCVLRLRALSVRSGGSRTRTVCAIGPVTVLLAVTISAGGEFDVVDNNDSTTMLLSFVFPCFLVESAKDVDK